MTHHETIHTLHTMAHFGGSFMRHLAAACLAADPNNRARLLEAFPEVEGNYGPSTRWYCEELA